jgi:hypothetical protein
VPPDLDMVTRDEIERHAVAVPVAVGPRDTDFESSAAAHSL